MNYVFSPDVDECVAYPNTCPENSKCENQYGGFSCACDYGYKSDGERCLGKFHFKG